jgi:hypothetical protein
MSSCPSLDLLGSGLKLFVDDIGFGLSDALLERPSPVPLTPAAGDRESEPRSLKLPSG